MATKTLATKIRIPGTAPVTVWSERAEKATPKLNGFYGEPVEFVAHEFANGLRGI